MVEVIDKKTEQKLMMMPMCEIKYLNDSYLVYCIQRDKVEANIFVSKAIKGSLGVVIDNDFSNGEKEVVMEIVKRLLNKESKEQLEREGFEILSSPKLDSSLVFDIDVCYVSTVSKKMIKDCLVFYELVIKDNLSIPVVEVKEDKSKFNEGFISSMTLIIIGVMVIIFSCVVIYGVLFK